jgi:hypothetical protein
MLLDTGSDITLIPRSNVDQLGIQVIADHKYELVGFDGTTSFASSVEVDMIFLRRVFGGEICSD